MALEQTCRNLHAAQAFVDVNVVTIVIVSGATPRDANRSCPNTTVVDATGGVYACTMPSGQFQVLLAASPVNAGATTARVTGLATANGVTSFNVTISDTTALAAGEELHVTFLVLGS